MLVYGIEGTHYKKIGENRIEIVPDTGYILASWSVGNVFNSYLFQGQDDNVWEETIKQNESAKTSLLMGFNFDPEPVKAEIAQCQSVIDEYTPGLWTGSVDPDTYLPQFIDKLMSSGSDRIIAEEQKQIDVWKSSK